MQETIEEILTRWKRDDAAMMFRFGVAGCGFVIAGVSGLLIMLSPFWLPLLQRAVCK